MIYPPPEICDPPTVTEYRQKREVREEAKRKIPERKIEELNQMLKIIDFDLEIEICQREQYDI